MARSMTGFGHAVVSKDGRELSIELKSVNHRFLDLALRMPRSLAFLEDTARNTLGTMLARGHVDIFANYRNTRNDSKKVEINMPMLSAYMTAARQAAEELGIENDLTLSRALRLTDIVSVTEADDDRPALAELMKDALTRAANELIAMRMREGERLSSDMKTRLGVIADIREKISERAPLVVEEQRKKLNERIESLLSETEIDRARLATEIALFADKVSIDEELVRLSSHIAASGELLENNGSIGRKLDFIVQEMNREFNTIGSKANDKTIASLVIDGKAELEKMREQVQNFE
ncbi:MAG: YicC family protein [Clostridium sp.]|nr:YicC family protein [Clostridium sp.]